MFKLYLFFISLCCATYPAQNSNLYGKWILEEIKYSDGKELEVNHPFYSTSHLIYIMSQSLFVNNHTEKAKYENTTINAGPFSYKYEFQGNYLILEPNNDNTKYYYLKESDFLNKYPEFNPQIVETEGLNVYSSHELFAPIIINWPDFQTKVILALWERKDYKPYIFDVNFVIDEDSKLEHYFFTNSSLDKTQENFIRSLVSNNGLSFINTSEKKMITTRSFNFNHRNASSSQKVGRKEMELAEWYRENKFDKLIREIPRLEESGFFKDSTHGNHRFVKLGVAYLAKNQITEACVAFRKKGDLKDFSVRKYLINFCN